MLKVEECLPGVMVEAIKDDVPVNRWHAANVPPIGSVWTIHDVGGYYHANGSFMGDWISLEEQAPLGRLRMQWELGRFRLVPSSRLDVFQNMPVSIWEEV